MPKKMNKRNGIKNIENAFAKTEVETPNCVSPSNKFMNTGELIPDGDMVARKIPNHKSLTKKEPIKYAKIGCIARFISAQ